jgi:hypothetical protein
MPPQRESSPGGWSALVLVGQLGLVMALCIVGGVLTGVFATRWLGGGGILVALGALLGIVGGGLGAYQLLARELPWNR